MSEPMTCPKCKHTFVTYVQFAGHNCKKRQELAKRMSKEVAK